MELLIDIATDYEESIVKRRLTTFLIFASPFEVDVEAVLKRFKMESIVIQSCEEMK